jgi:hypothetical protein
LARGKMKATLTSLTAGVPVTWKAASTEVAVVVP